MIELGVDDGLTLRRSTHMAQDHGNLQGISDVEMEDGDEVTPRARYFQKNAEDVYNEAYETPLVLKKPKRRAQPVRVEDSDAETHTSEVLQLDTDGENTRRGPTAHIARLTSESVKVRRQGKLSYKFD